MVYHTIQGNGIPYKPMHTIPYHCQCIPYHYQCIPYNGKAMHTIPCITQIAYHTIPMHTIQWKGNAYHFQCIKLQLPLHIVIAQFVLSQSLRQVGRDWHNTGVVLSLSPQQGTPFCLGGGKTHSKGDIP
jgi:hypothetical protein